MPLPRVVVVARQGPVNVALLDSLASLALSRDYSPASFNNSLLVGTPFLVAIIRPPR